MKREMLLLIDGSSILNACYYATIPFKILTEKDNDIKKTLLKENLKRNKDGLYINGVEVMIKVIFKLLRDQNPTHIAIAWDITRDTFRREIYPLYKRNREEVDSFLKEQFITMQNILQEMGIAQFYDNKYEADDYIGTLSKRFEDELPVYIYTKDKDALQLISDKTKLWLINDNADKWCKEYGLDRNVFNIPHNAFELNIDCVKDIFGVYPENIVDLKALVGDTSDNIPGVKGIGEKSAIPLINHYESIENLFFELEDLSKDDLIDIKNMWKDDLNIKRSPLNTFLKEDSKESAILSKKLSKIVTDIDLNINLNEVALNIKMSNIENVLEKYSIIANPKEIC